MCWVKCLVKQPTSPEWPGIHPSSVTSWQTVSTSNDNHHHRHFYYILFRKWIKDSKTDYYFFYHYSNCLLEAIGYLRVLTINAVNWDGLQLFLLLVIVKKYHHDISYLSRWVWFFLNTKFVIIFNFYHLFVVNVFIHLPIF